MIITQRKRKVSKIAQWCLRLAILPLPMTLIAVILHRDGFISPSQLFWVLAIAIMLLFASLLIGGLAASDLWRNDTKGGRTTVKGISLAILLLIPFGIQLSFAIQYPRLNDVASDVIDPPLFINASHGGNDQMLLVIDGELQGYDPFVIKKIILDYPELLSRRYSALPDRILLSVEKILKRWQAEIIASQLPPGISFKSLVAADQEAGEAQEELNASDTLAGGEQEIQPDDQQDLAQDTINSPEIVIHATTKSLFLQLPHNLVIRMRENNNTTIVDMRAASNWGRHDFGSNASLIEQFLETLDKDLAGLAGEN